VTMGAVAMLGWSRGSSMPAAFAKYLTRKVRLCETLCQTKLQIAALSVACSLIVLLWNAIVICQDRLGTNAF
jgi:hypothetical protein